MTNEELVRQLSIRSKDITLVAAREILTTLDAIIRETLSKGEDVVIGKLGTIRVRIREAMEKYSVGTKQKELFPPKVIVRFEPFAGLKTLVNKDNAE